MKTVFDGTGNYTYHRNCVRGAFSVGAQQLARLRKAIHVQTSEPIEYVAKESIFNSFWILWTKTWHQTDEKKGVMEKPSISIPSSHRFVHLTKTILNTATNANEVFYEFNCTLAMEGLGSISVGTFNWLKKYRPYVGICPPMSDYCDKCKEHEEIS